jgi:hypothetical protein
VAVVVRRAVRAGPAGRSPPQPRAPRGHRPAGAGISGRRPAPRRGRPGPCVLRHRHPGLPTPGGSAAGPVARPHHPGPAHPGWTIRRRTAVAAALGGSARRTRPARHLPPRRGADPAGCSSPG